MKTALEENLLRKFELLSKTRQQEVIDFLDFVFERFLDEIEENDKKPIENEEDFVVTEELREFLNYRLKRASLHRDKAITSEEFDKKIKEKYNWK
ncbi:MAG: hypothetical protein AAF518_27135 [Spirochaetota bacterium]